MSLLDDASIVITPNGVKVSTLFAVIPSDGAADMDFTRATTATRIDERGFIVEVGDGVPRIDYDRGGVGCPYILAEPQRTNILFPSEVGATQTLTVTAVEQVFTFYGTGTVVLSGAHAETLVGTGTDERFELKFTPTAGSLTLTVTGTVTNWQLEVGSYPTSVIITSVGTVTRNQETFTRAGISSLINSTEGVLFVEMAALSDDLTLREITLSDGSYLNYVLIRFNSGGGNRIYTRVNVGGGLEYFNLDTSHTITDTNKIAIRWEASNFATFINGVKIDFQLSGSSFAADTLNELNFDNGTGGNPLYAKVKQIQVYQTALTDPQLAALTS